MDYTKLGSRVSSIVRKYGKPVTLEQVGSSATYTKTFNAAQGRYQWQLNVEPFTIVYVDPSVPVSSDGYAVETKTNYSELNRSNVHKEDRSFLLVDIPRPYEHDILIVGLDRLKITTVESIQPSSVPLAYKVVARG